MNERKDVQTSFPAAGDGTFVGIAPCAECGSTSLMLDDGLFCADCDPDS